MKSFGKEGSCIQKPEDQFFHIIITRERAIVENVTFPLIIWIFFPLLSFFSATLRTARAVLPLKWGKISRNFQSVNTDSAVKNRDKSLNTPQNTAWRIFENTAYLSFNVANRSQKCVPQKPDVVRATIESDRYSRYICAITDGSLSLTMYGVSMRCEAFDLPNLNCQRLQCNR